MTELEKLKSRIEDAIHANNQGEITGDVLQETLLDMVDTISDNANTDDCVTTDDFNEMLGIINNTLATKANASTTYTKEEVDQAIEDIDVTGQLATVATTGDYNDLINKPTINATVVNETLVLTASTGIDTSVVDETLILSL